MLPHPPEMPPSLDYRCMLHTIEQYDHTYMNRVQSTEDNVYFMGCLSLTTTCWMCVHVYVGVCAYIHIYVMHEISISFELNVSDVYDDLHYKKRKCGKHACGVDIEAILPSEGEVRLLWNRHKLCVNYLIGIYHSLFILLHYYISSYLFNHFHLCLFTQFRIDWNYYC